MREYVEQSGNGERVGGSRDYALSRGSIGSHSRSPAIRVERAGLSHCFPETQYDSGSRVRRCSPAKKAERGRLSFAGERRKGNRGFLTDAGRERDSALGERRASETVNDRFRIPHFVSPVALQDIKY